MRLLSRHAALSLIIAACGGLVMHLLWAETPHGRVKGTLLTAERGIALAGIEVSLVRTDERQSTYHTTTDQRGHFAFRHVQVGRYRLIAETLAHKQPQEKIEVSEGRIVTVVFELEPTEPFLRVFQRQKVLASHEEPRLRCHGFVPVNQLAVKVYEVASQVAIRNWQGWLPSALTTRGQPLRAVSLDRVPELSLVSSPIFQIAGRDPEGVFRQEITLDRLPPGMYLVAIEAGELRKLAVLTVTDLALVVKASPEEVLIWAVNIDTGDPVARTSVEAIRDGLVAARAETNNDGLASLRLPSTDESSGLRVVGRAGKSIAMASVWRYRYGDSGPLRVYTYTDRPVYRPGQKVYFKSVMRKLEGDQYQVPRKLAARVQVVDQKDNLVYGGEHATNNFGSLHGEFDLSQNALPGAYTLTLSTSEGSYRSTFSVAEYRKPEFEVTVTPTRKRYTRGDTIKAMVEAKYYYGAPVPDAEVRYYVTRSPYWYYGEYEDWDTDFYEPYGYEEGELVASGVRRTDKNGRLAIVFRAEVEGDDTNGMGQDYQFAIHADVTDPSRRFVSGSGTVLVTQGEFRLQVSLDDSMAEPGQSVGAIIRATDYDDHPVANARGEAVLALCRWEEGREHFQVKERQSWRTDQEGQAKVSVTPTRDGNYRLLVKAKDKRANLITNATWMWVMSGSYASFAYPYHDLDVRADRDGYREGDVAQIIVNTKHAPATALLTIEGAKIMEKRLVRLQAKSSIIEVKVRPEFMPSVYARVCLVKGKEFLSGDAAINVSRERKSLRIQITSDQPTYQPGQRAVYRVKTATAQGQPVQAEVSLAVVDEAIYAIAPDRVPNILHYFYPKQPLQVDTAFSFPEVYLDADDKAAAKIRTRRRFRDTAFWQPAAVTDANGQATFQFTMPDNLTTWRATCRAATLDTQVGQDTYQAVVRKPFLVRLAAPRFFTQGDQVRIAAVAHNLTQRRVAATVGLEASGFRLLDKDKKKCRIAAGQTKRVEWRVQVDEVGPGRLRVWAKAGELSDAMELTLPVLPKGRARSDVRSGVVQSKADLRFEVRKDCIPGTQEFTIRLTPSLASAMLGALEYLAAYPYGCVEQTMSAFLPDIMIMQMLDKVGVDNPALRKKLPKMVEAGLLKLYDCQHGDGGWGWWKYDRSDPWMTAYVVFGLVQAKAAGFRVTDHVLERGLGALERLASEKDQNTQAYAAYVLALAGRRDGATRMVGRYLGWEGSSRQARLSDWGKAMLALAMNKVGQGDRGRALLEQVWGHFSQRASVAGEWSQVESGAALLIAACQLTPYDQRLPKLARWIIEQRRANHWNSTRDTAFVLYGLSDYLLIADELRPDMNVVVSVNGRVAATKHFTATDVFRPELAVRVDKGDLGSGEVAVAIEKKGKGRLYYTATLNQVVATDLTVPVRSSSGISIERSYRELVLPARSKGDLPAKASLSFSSGEVIEVTLEVRAERHFEHIMVEDMLPAGCEPGNRGRIEPWEWEYWWADQVVRDEKVAFAIRHLTPGAHRLKYHIYAQVPGYYTVLPAQAYDMYNPATRADGISHILRISP